MSEDQVKRKKKVKGSNIKNPKDKNKINYAIHNVCA